MRTARIASSVWLDNGTEWPGSCYADLSVERGGGGGGQKVVGGGHANIWVRRAGHLRGTA